MAAEKLRRAQHGLRVIDFCYPKRSTKNTCEEESRNETNYTTDTDPHGERTESGKSKRQAAGRGEEPQTALRKDKNRATRPAEATGRPRTRNREKETEPPASQGQGGGKPTHNKERPGRARTTKNPEGAQPKNRWPQGSQQQRSARGRKTITRQRGAALPQAAGTRGPAG